MKTRFLSHLKRALVKNIIIYQIWRNFEVLQDSKGLKYSSQPTKKVFLAQNIFDAGQFDLNGSRIQITQECEIFMLVEFYDDELLFYTLLGKKRFYNRETIFFIRISSLTESFFTLIYDWLRSLN